MPVGSISEGVKCLDAINVIVHLCLVRMTDGPFAPSQTASQNLKSIYFCSMIDFMNQALGVFYRTG